MSVIYRGIRNAFRNGIRTFSIIIILGLSMGLAVTMFVARQAVQAKIDSVKASIGNSITISPAGANGFEGGGEPLTNDQITKIRALPHVVGVAESVNDRLKSTDTNLLSAIEAGSLGQRRVRVFSMRGENENFTPPIIAIGTNTITTLQSLSGGKVQITAGKAIDPQVDQPLALVGQALATKNNLTPGATFQAYNTTLTTAGIFDAGNKFTNSALVLSLPTEQRLSGQTNAITSATAQIDSITNLDSSVAAIKSALGSTADVVSQQDSSNQALAPLDTIKTISFFSFLGAITAGAVIILLTMLMIVRERRREIGVLKAIGASNATVVMQFITEAVAFTFLGAIVGIVVGVLASNPVIKLLVNNATGATQVGPRMSGGGGFLRALNQGTAVSIHAVQATIGWNVVIYGLLIALVIAIIGSAIPAWIISKIRPAEVMRAE